MKRLVGKVSKILDQVEDRRRIYPNQVMMMAMMIKPSRNR